MSLFGPGSRIAQLPPDVVDRIAAGEVVVRPVNAVKELLENSLDAGATEVTVSIKAGGLELIRVQDNGRGIVRDDLPIACQRFSTSKLHSFEDLTRISTFGFRGEALASISFVSTVTIATRTGEDKCANRAVYKDGNLVGPITPSAGLPGTNICVENLFYTVPLRKNTFKYPQEEANRVADLLVRYAIHLPSVAFAYRRLDGGGAYDFRSPGSGDQHAVVRALLHEKASKELVDFHFDDPRLHFSARACMSTPAVIFTSTAIQTRHDRQKVFHLFINGRSVESPRLRQAFDAVFSAKDALCPFISLSLQIEPQRVDVNVHPTKSVVHFLDEDRVIERIEQEVHKLLAEYHIRGAIHLDQSSGNTLCKNIQQKQNRKRKLSVSAEEAQESSRKSTTTKGVQINKKPTKVAAKDRIRVDFTNRSLDEWTITKDDLDNPMRTNSQVRLIPMDAHHDHYPLAAEIACGGMDTNPILLDADAEGEEGNKQQSFQGTIRCTPRMFEFDSLVSLRREICRKADKELVGVFRRHLVIGFVGTRETLLQSSNKVFMIRNGRVLQDFFYQLIIFSFGNMGAYDLVQAHIQRDFLPIRELLKLHLEVEEEGGTTTTVQLLENGCQMLVRHRNLLWNYFSIKVLSNHRIGTVSPLDPLLATIPCLIDGYVPDLLELPRLLWRLANIDYENEKNCYAGIAWALAEFYVPNVKDDGLDQQRTLVSDSQKQRKWVQRVLKALIFPAMKNRFLPDSGLGEGGDVQLLTTTGQAFKHFGRC